MNLLDDDEIGQNQVECIEDEEIGDKPTSKVILDGMGTTRRNLIFSYVPKDEKVACAILKKTIDEFFELHELGIEEIKTMLCEAVMKDQTWMELKSLGLVDNGGATSD